MKFLLQRRYFSKEIKNVFSGFWLWVYLNFFQKKCMSIIYPHLLVLIDNHNCDCNIILHFLLFLNFKLSENIAKIFRGAKPIASIRKNAPSGANKQTFNSKNSKNKSNLEMALCYIFIQPLSSCYHKIYLV